MPSGSRIRDLDIEFYRARVARDPRSARDFTQLAGLYLQRARETADNEDLVRAEETARHSLALRRGRNERGLRRAGLEPPGAAPVRRGARRRPGSARGGLDLDRGARPAWPRPSSSSDATTRPDGSSACWPPIRATWASRHGWRAGPSCAGGPRRRGGSCARRATRRAGATACRASRSRGFISGSGDLALRAGQLDEAERELEAGLAILPGDYRLLGALARLHAVRHDWRRAADAGELAVSRALDPATLGLLHDAWAALGDTAKAEEYYRAMAVAVLRQPGPYHRAWSLFLLDHDREVPARARRTSRRSSAPGGTSTATISSPGRCTSRAGTPRPAAPMARALALGTRDAMLYFHAGMIDRSLGDTASARARLETALAINPSWHPSQPAEARAVLDSLTR